MYICLSTKNFSLFISMDVFSVCCLSRLKPLALLLNPSENRDQYVTVFLLTEDQLPASISYML